MSRRGGTRAHRQQWLARPCTLSPLLPRVELAESTCLQPLVVLVDVLPIWEDLPALRWAPL